MTIYKRLAGAFGALALTTAGALAFAATPAQAHHAPPTLGDPVYGDCGETTLVANKPEVPHGSYAGAALVVQVGDEHHVAALGEPITVGPFTEERVAIRWRIWGGGERDYDSPQLDNLGQLLDYLNGPDRLPSTDDDRSPTDKDAWGAAWNNLGVDGCVPPVSPPPATEQPEPTPGPEPSATPAPGVGGGADEELPVTGAGVLPLLALGGSALVIGVVAYAINRRRITFAA